MSSTISGTRRISFALAAVLALLPLAACEAQEAGEDVHASNPEEDDYADRMAAEHAGEDPSVAGAAREGAGAADVTTEEVVYATVGGEEIAGYLARPKTPGHHPGLIVIHEWYGLNDHIETMARMFAQQGYAALAVDLYAGEAAGSPERARELTQSVVEAEAQENLRQAYGYLTQTAGAERVGVVGWCFGGGWALRTALLLPEQIDATVIYYGRLVDDREQLATLDMPILGHFGAEDQGIPVAGVREFAETLEELDKHAEIHVYEGAGHAFANPSGERYEPAAARTSWDRTLRFLEAHLSDTGQHHAE